MKPKKPPKDVPMTRREKDRNAITHMKEARKSGILKVQEKEDFEKGLNLWK